VNGTRDWLNLPFGGRLVRDQESKMSDGTDYIQRARDLAPMLREAEADIESHRELPQHVVSALIDGGFFRMLQPRFLGGAELRPVLFSRVTEALAQTNASVAWCIGQNNGCSMSAAYLDRDVAQEIFGPPTGILAWGPPGSPYEAQPVDGGYRINGRWRFASGCHHATWLGAHMPIAGSGKVRTMLFRKSSVQMNDIWHTIGLRGTASNEYVVTDLFVPQRYTMARDTEAERREQGPLYRFTSNQLYSCGFAGVGLGIARGTIDDFLDLPANKVSRGASRPMRENNVVQSQLAQCEARWRSARAFLHTTWETAWQRVEATGEQTAEDRAMIRLTSTWAIQQSREIVNTLYHAAGSMAVFEEQPFEQRLRDIHTVAQQSQGRQLHYESVGQILFGMEPENQF
jgi:alkylation response protein AidB-like acyl-CoA dehydrogenase